MDDSDEVIVGVSTWVWGSAEAYQKATCIRYIWYGMPDMHPYNFAFNGDGFKLVH